MKNATFFAGTSFPFWKFGQAISQQWNCKTDANLKEFLSLRTDANLSDRITKFATTLADGNTYQLPLRFLVDLGLLNQQILLDMKIICTLETKMSRRFESNKNVCALPCTEPDAQIIYHATHYILYQQIRLNDLYKQYLETALLSKKVFRTGLQKSLLKKSYELASGLQFYARIFEAAHRQFDWLEISLA